MMLRDLESMPEKETWTMLVKRLLCTLGFNNGWLAQGVGNVNSFRLEFGKTNIAGQFYPQLEFKIDRFQKSNFCTSISSFHFQNYLTVVKVKKYRNAFSRLRCSSRILEIESGRWHRPIRKPIEEKKCRNCNVIENEFHFLLECSLYNDLRIQYLDSYFYENPNHFKLKKLFQSTQEK